MPHTCSGTSQGEHTGGGIAASDWWCESASHCAEAKAALMEMVTETRAVIKEMAAMAIR